VTTTSRVIRRAKHDAVSAIGGYIEIEAPSGSRMMIPQHHIEMICEHGVQPVYKIIGNGASRRKSEPPAG